MFALQMLKGEMIGATPRRKWAIELVGSWDSARGVAASRLVAFVAC